MGHTNTRQIAKYQTGKALIEFNDRLSPAPPEKASILHGPFSKIHVVALDYSQGTGDKAVLADLNLNPDTAKYLAHAILHGMLTEFQEQKVLAHKVNEQGQARVTIFSIDYKQEMRYPWIVQVENGVGLPEKQPTGGTALQRGTYVREKTVKIFVGDQQMQAMMLQLIDYIRTFETVHFGALMEVRAEFEEKEKAQAQAQA